MIFPRPLFPGARVALVGPSGPVPPERLEPALEAIAALGLVPVLFPSATALYGYLAGPDWQRAQDLTDAFADPDIDGILCIRGGYGAQRMLPYFDPTAALEHPKLFCGYSDVTALHILLNQTGEGLCTFHTPMPSTEWYQGLDDYTLGSLRKALFAPGEAWGSLENAPGTRMEVLNPGTALGTLCGGNLSLVASSLGTPYEIDTRGRVLFLEDIGEKPYRIDGMLTQLRNAGKLACCAGILLGAWTDCEAPEPDKSLTLDQVIEDVVLPVCRQEGIPLVSGLTCGHVLPTMSLPLGAVLRVDAREAVSLAITTTSCQEE